MNIPDEISLYLPYLLLAINTIMLVAATLAVLVFRRRNRRPDALQQAPSDRTHVDRAAEHQRHQLLLGLRIDSRLSRLEVQLQELRNVESSDRPLGQRQLTIDHAIRMARGGASIDELTRTCGLSLGEARLTHKLHGGLAATAKLQ